MQQEHSFSVEDTNQEALASKISAVRKGYFNDNYAEEFAKYKGKRDIIMHRGYWARVYIVRRLVQTMIKNGQDVQIIALGSGLETLWFNIQQQNILKNAYTFIELDLKSVVKRKIKKIQSSKKILNLFQSHNITYQINGDRSELRTNSSYKLAACDLSSTKQFQQVIESLKIDVSKPTFFYAQCVLSYIDADKVDQLLSYINKQFSFAYLFDYEMYDPNDRFGQMMVKNFNLMGCPLQGIYKYPNLKDQQTRFYNAHFKHTQCQTMIHVYNTCIQAQQRKKVQKVQMLDQFQEWNLIMGHYFALLSLTYHENVQNDPKYANIIQQMKLKK